MKSAFFSTQSKAATTGVYVAAIVPVIGGLIATPHSTFSLSDFFFSVLLYGLSLALGALFGLPIFMLLARLRLLRWWATLVGGSIIGACVAALISLPHTPQLRSIGYFGSEGAVSALVFWVFWILGPEPTVSSAKVWVYGPRELPDGL